MNTARTVEIYKYKDNEKYKTFDEIIVEFELLLIVNGHELIKFICTPENMKELAIGYLYSENIISGYGDIKSITFEKLKENKGKVVVVVNDNEEYMYTESGLSCVKTITSACGNNRTHNLPIISKYTTPLRSEKLDLEKISEIMKEFNKKSDLFMNTGGVHSCAFATLERIIKFAEDIGRHNALDKIVGMLIKENVKATDRILLTSGRISSEIVYKALSGGVCTLVSRSAPTSEALIIGEKYNMTIIGFARGNRMNVYTGFDFL